MPQPLAIVDVGDADVRLTATPCSCLDQPLRDLGATELRVDAEWSVPLRRLEPLLSLLDRCGYVWTFARREALPRTWAERLFAEVPPEHHPDLLDACRHVLADLPDHVALLECAYLDASDPDVGGIG